MRKIIITAILTGLLILNAISAHAIELKFAHAAPASDLQQVLATFFANEISKQTDGNITVKIFPHGQLGNDEQMITAIRSGIIDIEMSGLNNFTGMMPKLGGLMLPFIFKTREQAYAVLDGTIGQEIGIRFESFGMKALGFPENGYRNITNNRGPIRKPEDVAGLRMRTNNSIALNELFALLKANPQQLPVAELYTALETGVVNAQDHPINITQSFKFYEVQKYLSLTQHSYSILAIAMNLNKFNSLTAEQQKIIQNVASKATAIQRQLSIDKEEAILTALKNEDMQINRDIDKAAFQRASRPIWDNYIAQFGDDLIRRIQASNSK